MKDGSLNSGEEGEHNGVNFVKKSEVFSTQDAIIVGSELFGRVWSSVRRQDGGILEAMRPEGGWGDVGDERRGLLTSQVS